MTSEILITIKPEDEKNFLLHKKIILSELKKNIGKIKSRQEQSEILNLKLADFENGKIHLQFLKKSIDARHGKVKFHLRYKVFIGENPLETEKKSFQWKNADGKKTVLIVGSGPAGLFGALKLLESGIKPVILERGAQTSQRKIDIAKISTQKTINEDSNYCFGEGGAGTFSDGKLYTRSNKRGDISEVLQIFHYFGADEKILTDAHPHIGTNKLPKIINNIREKIISLGGEIHFNTRVTDFILNSDDKTVNSTKQCGQKLTYEEKCFIHDRPNSSNPNKNSQNSHILDKNPSSETRIVGANTKNVLTGEEQCFFADAVLLATGHSATDIYQILAKIAPESLEAKTFAAGVRVEHPRSLIDKIQYHSNESENLGAAEYRLTTQVAERGVYSFCMCPGGFVVPSSSGQNEIVVNGMSAAQRNSKWSNAAIVVEIRPEDIPHDFIEQAEKLGCKALAGLLFRTHLEHLAKQNGNIQAAPAQRLKDFLNNKKSQTLPDSSYTPGLISSNLCEWLPDHIYKRLQQGFRNFNQNMKGFICDDALLIAIETRTSTPVRILRNKENFESTVIKSLYPVGEGSGYSGGIVSSAMDGINACTQLAKKWKTEFKS